MSKFTEIKISTTHAAAELVADMLWEYSPEGVAVIDPQDGEDLERMGKNWDYKDDAACPSDGGVYVIGYIIKKDGERALGEIKTRLSSFRAECPFDVGDLEISIRETDGDLWKKIWKERFKPIKIGRVTVVPEWIEYTPTDGEIKLIIGSDMAFGTGEHQTTAMCVEFLQKYVRAGDSVIDVGCGSGILGICAAKLGASRVLLTDLDECAVDASVKNIAINGVTCARVELKNLLDGESDTGNVVVCNITAEPLIAFAPDIGKHVLPGGYVILSGILSDRLDKVEKAYLDSGFKLLEDKTDGEWSACVFAKENA